MGVYLNPKGVDKAEWLAKLCVEKLIHVHHTAPVMHIDYESNTIAVCLVDNGSFTALAVAYSKAELDTFATEDGRRKIWAMLPFMDVCEVLDIHDIKVIIESGA